MKSFSFVPHQIVGSVDIPEIYMPYGLRQSPHLAAARRNVVEWARRMGFLQGIWHEDKLIGFDFALCTAHIHPDSSAEQLDLSTAWLAWGTYADDYFPLVYGRNRDIAGAKLFTARLAGIMAVDGEEMPLPINPVESSLGDLWTRTVATMNDATKRQFRLAVLDMTDSWLWELANQAQNRIPDPIDYVEMRRRTFGSELTMSLAKLSLTDEVPAEIYRTTPMRGLENSAADFACLVNDIFSFQKEIQFEGELNNGVLVTRTFLECDNATAINVVNDLMTARVKQFERTVELELPVLFDAMNLEPTARRAVAAYVERLQDWMAGVLRWHQGTKRYDESELLQPLPMVRAPWQVPTGVSTLHTGMSYRV